MSVTYLLNLLSGLSLTIALALIAILRRRLEACIPAMYGALFLFFSVDSLISIGKQSRGITASLFLWLTMVGFIYESAHLVIDNRKKKPYKEQNRVIR